MSPQWLVPPLLSYDEGFGMYCASLACRGTHSWADFTDRHVLLPSSCMKKHFAFCFSLPYLYILSSVCSSFWTKLTKANISSSFFFLYFLGESITLLKVLQRQSQKPQNTSKQPASNRQPVAYALLTSVTSLPVLSCIIFFNSSVYFVSVSWHIIQIRPSFLQSIYLSGTSLTSMGYLGLICGFLHRFHATITVSVTLSFWEFCILPLFKS